MDTPELLGDVEIKFIPSYQAKKDYTCPWCNRPITPGTAHYAIVPVNAPDLRRHWHRGCWNRRPESRTGPSKLT